MAPPLDYIQLLGQQECQQIVRDKRRGCTEDPITGCWLYSGSANNDGYCQVWLKPRHQRHLTGRNVQKAFLLHVIATVARTGQNIPQHYHASHLCDRRNCFNPDHLQAETITMNNSRKGCPGPIYCAVHGHLIVDLCAHSPRCIRPPRDDVNCCLALKESLPAGAWSTQQTEWQRRTASVTGSRPSTAGGDRSDSQGTNYSGASALERAAADGFFLKMYLAVF